MKKKIISLLVVFCFIFPCFFSVACKNKISMESIKPYTYSVVLKNASGKIDENTLKNEYDFEKEEEVSWTKAGDDFSISVTRTTAISNKTIVSLLEGYDYSNIDFKLNGLTAGYKVVSGNDLDCSEKAYLSDRQFQYEYQNMSDDTNLVIDFVDCDWAKIDIDVSELREKSIKYYEVEDEFITSSQSSEISFQFQNFNSNRISVDYGTILAFDYQQPLTFTVSETNQTQDMNYSTYGAKYFVSTNRVQYITAIQNGACEVYNVKNDRTQNNSLRILSYSGLKVYSRENFNRNPINFNEVQFNTNNIEKEWYDGELLSLNVFYGNDITHFVALTGDAEDYVYYLLNSIDEECSINNKLTELVNNSSGIKYFSIDTQNSVKYLVRRPKLSTNYYAVYFDELPENTKIENVAYTVVGTQTSDIPTSVTDKVVYYIKKTENVILTVGSTSVDKVTNALLSNSRVSIYAYNIDKFGGKVDVDITTSNYDFEDINRTAIVDCFSGSDENFVYCIETIYNSKTFLESSVNLDFSNIYLYENEEVFISTDITSSDSWKKLEDVTDLSISSGNGSTIYYYFKSNRTDAGLQILDNNDNQVSLTGVIRDCFGRQKQGSVEVDGTIFELKNVRYLNIKPGYYSSYTATLARDYDKTKHSINFDNILDKDNVMIFVGNYVEGLSEFVKLSEIKNLEIQYRNQMLSSQIYYYVKSSIKKHLVLKDEENNIVAASSPVLDEYFCAITTEGCVVYNFSIIGDFYDLDETFYLSVEQNTYKIVDKDGDDVTIYYNSLMEIEVDSVKETLTYYFVGTADKMYYICDKYESIVCTATQYESSIEEGKDLYSFTFPLLNQDYYSNGEEFILKSN